MWKSWNRHLKMVSRQNFPTTLSLKVTFFTKEKESENNPKIFGNLTRTKKKFFSLNFVKRSVGRFSFVTFSGTFLAKSESSFSWPTENRTSVPQQNAELSRAVYIYTRVDCLSSRSLANHRALSPSLLSLHLRSRSWYLVHRITVPLCLSASLRSCSFLLSSSEGM